MKGLVNRDNQDRRRPVWDQGNATGNVGRAVYPASASESGGPVRFES